jgi:hypothetical protein
MLQPRVILKALGQEFQIVVRESGGSLRMNQPGMLRESRRCIHYNVKARRSDLSKRGAADRCSSTWRFSRKLSSHGIGRFLRFPAKEH